MRLIESKSNWQKYQYKIFGIKITKRKKRPAYMKLSKRTKYLKKVFFAHVGYPLNVNKPQTFNEKIQWLKLFYRNDLMTKIVDKYEFKNYIREQLGEGYTVPLLGVWDNVDDIDFDKLPNKFVLKCNAQSDSKFIKIVKNKDELDIPALKEEMKHWLIPEETLKTSFCWAYHNVPLRIIAEEYIEQIDGQVYDYKFMCFNGEPRWVLACSDRGNNTVYENHDMDWGLIIPSPKSARQATIEKPHHFEEMTEIARKLAQPFPFVRVDFYEIEGKILLGEMTFYPNGGYNTYKREWDKKFGDMIELPDIKVKMPLFEKVKYKNKYVINLLGHKIFSYHKRLSRKEMTKQLDRLNNKYWWVNHELQSTKIELQTTKDELQSTKVESQTAKDELDTAKNELNSLNKILQSAQSDIRNVQRDLRSRPKLRPGKMRLEERIEYLKYVFSYDAGYKLNLRNPQTFNEKINWMKLFYRNPIMTRIVDKYEFKNYIREQLGDGYTVPLLGAWDNVEDIDFDKLPDKFVFKCNAQSDSKFIKIVKNKDELDIPALKQELQEWLIPDNTLKTSFCWAYHNVPLKIIAEEYIEQIDEQVYDYKFFCFHGEPRIIEAMKDRKDGQYLTSFYDTDWNLLDLHLENHADSNLEKPKSYDKMLEISKFLSKEFPLVRVDFYEINDKIYIGEMTFYTGGGYFRFEPKEWDYTLGSWLDLTKIPSEHLDVPDEYSAMIKTEGEYKLCSA